MYKKIIAGVLAAAAIFALFFIPSRLFRSEKTADIYIGAANFKGRISPFISASSGEKAVTDMAFTKLVYECADTTVTASDSVPSAAASFRVFYTDGKFTETDKYTEGGYTASEYVLKRGMKFSDGTPITPNDVMFSVYTFLDPLCEADNSAFEGLAGLNDYIYDKKGMSENIKKARKMLSKDTGYVPTEEDDFTAEEFASFAETVAASGKKFAESIRTYILDEYCTDELTSSYIFSGIHADEVRHSEALLNAYTMMLWSYGSFTYSYIEDPAGSFVASYDTNGAIIYKTTLEKALADDNMCEYVYDEAGNYYFDWASGKYAEYSDAAEGTLRYSRVLSNKYFTVSKSALTGFRDIEGTTYSLLDDSYPTLDDFFSLMRNTYTSDGVFDYEAMERTESANHDLSFSESAAVSFADKNSSNETVLGIDGIRQGKKTVDGVKYDTVTFYYDGSCFDKAYGTNFSIVSRACFTDGFDYKNDKDCPFGVLKNNKEFFEHIKSIKTPSVSSGAYTPDSSDSTGAFLLTANEYFETVGGDKEKVYKPLISVIGVKSVSAKDASQKLKGGDIALYASPVGASDTADDEAVTKLKVSTYSYKYLLINPSYYKSIYQRQAIISLIDTKTACTDVSSSRIKKCIPVFCDAYSPDNCFTDIYDPTGATALELFDKAGYTVNENGELCDPQTKKKASFVFTMLPSEKDTKIHYVLTQTVLMLSNLGADAEIVFDENLKNNVYSEGGVPIYVMGWEVDKSLSLYERYAFSSGTDAVAACGIKKLFLAGQLDNYGKLDYKNILGADKNANQSDAVSDLDEIIKAAYSTVDRSERNRHIESAAELISELCFEVPMCQNNVFYIFNNGIIDRESLPEEITSAKSPISEIWKLKKAD